MPEYDDDGWPVEEIPGPCCACGAENRPLRNIVCLDVKGPAPGKGWGCVVCGLPSDGAVAVVCDECVDTKRDPSYACAGYPLEPGRVPLVELSDRHEHDAGSHE